MADCCLLEYLLYAILPLVTIVSFASQLCFIGKYPWYLFGETFSKTRKPSRISCKLWVVKKNKRNASVEKESDMEITEMTNVDHFEQICRSVGKDEKRDHELDPPWHVAIPTNSSFIPCLVNRQTGCHHFVVISMRYLSDSNDYAFQTLEYDGNCCSWPLLKSGQCCNGQVQEKLRLLSNIFTSRGSLFFWQANNDTESRDSVLKQFAKLQNEVSWELIINNCEHFVNYLLRGKHVSYQIFYRPFVKCVFARCMAGLLRGQLSTTGILRLLSMILAHLCNALLISFVSIKEKYEIIWLMVSGIELLVLLITDALYFRQIMIRSGHLTEAFIEVLLSLLFFFLATSSFLLGTLIGHFHPSCDQSIENEIFLSVVFTFFALCFLHPILAGSVDYLFYKGGRKPLKLEITCVDNNLEFESYEINPVNLFPVIFGVIIIIIFGLVLFVAPLFALIHFDGLEDVFFNNVTIAC